MTTQEFINKYTNRVMGYPNGQYAGECLSIVKVYIKEKFGINPPASGCNAARCYWSKFPSPLGTVFKKVANTTSGVPKEGDIMVWNGNVGDGYGHISIVSTADKNSFTSFDQNWGGKHGHLVKHNYNNIYGWLTPKRGAGMASGEYDKLMVEIHNRAVALDDKWNGKFTNLDRKLNIITETLIEMEEKVGVPVPDELKPEEKEAVGWLTRVLRWFLGGK